MELGARLEALRHCRETLSSSHSQRSCDPMRASLLTYLLRARKLIPTSPRGSRTGGRVFNAPLAA